MPHGADGSRAMRGGGGAKRGLGATGSIEFGGLFECSSLAMLNGAVGEFNI